MQPTAGYPVQVQAQLDPRLSRWLWLARRDASCIARRQLAPRGPDEIREVLAVGLLQRPLRNLLARHTADREEAGHCEQVEDAEPERGGEHRD